MAFISKVLSLIIAAVTALCGFLFPPNVEVPQVAEGQVRAPRRAALRWSSKPCGMRSPIPSAYRKR